MGAGSIAHSPRCASLQYVSQVGKRTGKVVKVGGRSFSVNCTKGTSGSQSKQTFCSILPQSVAICQCISNSKADISSAHGFCQRSFCHRIRQSDFSQWYESTLTSQCAVRGRPPCTDNKLVSSCACLHAGVYFVNIYAYCTAHCAGFKSSRL